MTICWEWKWLATVLYAGLSKGMRSLLRLSKFVLPTVFVLALLQHSPLFPLLARLLTPLTAPLGLPGDAALVLVTGLLINKFAAIAGLLLLPLSQEQFFVSAVFLALAHNVVLELLIVWKSGLPVVRFALLRTGIAYMAGVLVHWMLHTTGRLSEGGSATLGSLARAGTSNNNGIGTMSHVSSASHVGSLNQASQADLFTTLTSGSLHFQLMTEAATQALHTIFSLALYLLPLFLLMELLHHLHLMTRLERLFAPLSRSLRLSPTLTPGLLGGLMLGVATGAGVIEETIAEGEYSRRELWRLNVFLLLFHSIFEDTLMFAILPVPIVAVAGVRFVVAWLASRLVP